MSSTPATDDLPLGTSAPFARMHTIIRRVCYVLLFALVFEGALTFPLLAIWYGVPALTPKEVCSELQKVMYHDESRECATHPFPQPPFRGPTEAENQTTSKDVWGVQPDPITDRVDFRELVRNKEHREAEAAKATTTTTPDGGGG